MAKKRKSKRRKSTARRLAWKTGAVLAVLLLLWGGLGEWFVHHPRAWLDGICRTWPRIVTGPLLWIGNPLADITDGLDLTGHDAVYEYDTDAPSGSVLFAGEPRRTGAPAPDDIRVLDRGEFKIGWSDSLRHPVWCAYHVTAESRFDDGERPSFLADRALKASPLPKDYTNSNYDRGHMVPNHAIVSRYGDAARRLTFLMSNVAPQSPALNRGVWRDVEHRIADFWTARYGEIWVIVGCIPSATGEKLSGTDIDVPSGYFQVILAQEGMDLRAVALYFPQEISWNAWAARHIITIDELEKLTGLDFNPDLDRFIQDPIESDLPSRLWPVRARDIFAQLLMRYR